MPAPTSLGSFSHYYHYGSKNLYLPLLSCASARQIDFHPSLQYIDSGANAIFSYEDGVATSREMLKDLGLNAYEADKRIVVMSNCLFWAGGPSIPLQTSLSGLLQISDLLKFGALKEEVKFDGN